MPGRSTPGMSYSELQPHNPRCERVLTAVLFALVAIGTLVLALPMAMATWSFGPHKVGQYRAPESAPSRLTLGLGC